MGASAFTATVALFEQHTDPNNNKTYTLMSVEGLGWDRTLGGRMFDEVLAQRFATKAAAKVIVDFMSYSSLLLDSFSLHGLLLFLTFLDR